ncbi:MAG: site-specific DNA-methyltransferase, partial [Opitutaceae bacterium]|nr:site-specific DNA-methyltransferase [Opitutaceae bacterium]
MTDPPYCSGGWGRSTMRPTAAKYTNGKSRDTRPGFLGENFDQTTFAEWCERWLSQCARIAKPDALRAAFIDFRNYATLYRAAMLAGWTPHSHAVWHKVAGRPAPVFRDHEHILIFTRGNPAIPGRIKGVLSIPRDRASFVHQTGKPYAL